MPRSIKVCKWCKKDFIPSHSRVKFCGPLCVKEYRKSIPITDEQKAKTSKTLKKYYEINGVKTKGEKHSKTVGKSTKGTINENPNSLYELSSRTISKIFKRLKLGCSKCGWNEASCDIHHIRGRKIPNANDHSNLTYICPNCHRLAHEKKLKEDDLISLDVYIGDKWKEVYYG
jgi:hypothetical protein